MSAKRQTKLTPAEWQARFNAAADAARREYCDMLAFWRACPYKRCRKLKRCSGDARTCLKRGIAHVPYEKQFEATNRIIAATAADADLATQAARCCPMFNHTL